MSIWPILSAALITFGLASCGPELPLGRDTNMDLSEVYVDKSTKRERIRFISDRLAQKGLRSSVLIAGLAEAESNFAHCWSEATWACKGPSSVSCNNLPVIAGKFDGPCSANQGGLGMFQFDSGTHNDTIAEYGRDILTIEGNAGAVLPFLVKKIRIFPQTAKKYGLSHIRNEHDLVQWMNSVQIRQGDTRFSQWAGMASCLYNGSCGGEKKDEYMKATLLLHQNYGEDLFVGNQTQTVEDQRSKPAHPPADGAKVCYRVKVIRTGGDPINIRNHYLGGDVVGQVREGETYGLLEIVRSGDVISDPLLPGMDTQVWLQIDVQNGAWLSGLYATCDG